MIDKLKRLQSIAAQHCDKVVIGDQYIHNLLSESNKKAVCMLFLPTEKGSNNVSTSRITTLKFRVGKSSKYDESFANEINVVEECEIIADTIIKHIRCSDDEFESYSKRVFLKEYDNLLTGCEVELSFSTQ